MDGNQIENEQKWIENGQKIDQNFIKKMERNWTETKYEIYRNQVK